MLYESSRRPVVSRIGKSSSSLSTGGSCSTGTNGTRLPGHRVLPEPASGGTARPGGPRRSTATGGRRAPRAARSVIPAWTGDRRRTSFQTASGSGSPQSPPIRLRELEDDREVVARPAGRLDAPSRTRWTRRSEFVTVPSALGPGRGRPAGRRRRARRSWSGTGPGRRGSRGPRAGAIARFWSASDWTGFSPMQ